MSEGMSFVDLALFLAATLIVLLALYMHSDGNRISATRFVYQDIRREMEHHPRRVVFWRAFNIAMGWRKRAGSSRRGSATPLRKMARKPVS